MSFLNPVNEPVLRFSSTDASAPQINYATRVAGDVKAVLKACLVTGYGAKASAGWTAVNETATVIEFVSPSVAMSDYRLGIDDTSATNTTWYYQYQDARVNPAENSLAKTFSWITANHASNGWELLVTARGMYFTEAVYHTATGKRFGRTIFFGQIKSALLNDAGQNIGFWTAGYQSVSFFPHNIFEAIDKTRKTYKLGSLAYLQFTSANILAFGNTVGARNTSAAALIDALYLHKDNNFAGQQPGILLNDVNDIPNSYGVYVTVFESRPVLYVCLGVATSDVVQIAGASRCILIYLDYWEY